MAIQIAQFLLMLSEVHKDGVTLQHFARQSGSRMERTTMPVSAFVYQFFLYNTLYSVNWAETQATGNIVYHPKNGPKEGPKQHRFVEFIRKLAEANPGAIQASFESLSRIDLSGPWTAIVPDPNISQAEGEEFFRSLRELVELIRGTESQVKSRMGKIFSRIETCRQFVYNVRNNIFHGTKTLGDMWDPDQRKRIHIYYLFLNCLVSSFFELVQDIPLFRFP